MEHVTDGVCDGVCDGVWLFGKDSFEECPLTPITLVQLRMICPLASWSLKTHSSRVGVEEHIVWQPGFQRRVPSWDL